jgi:hypothetical protein
VPEAVDCGVHVVDSIEPEHALPALAVFYDLGTEGFVEADDSPDA